MNIYRCKLGIFFFHPLNKYAEPFEWTAKGEICSDIGRLPLDDKNDCIKAALSHSLDYTGQASYSEYPGGCFQITSVFWNKNATGNRSKVARTLCRAGGEFNHVTSSSYICIILANPYHFYIIFLFSTDRCFTSNTNKICSSDWASCCPGGDGSGAICASPDCSNPGVTPCEGTWMSKNCEAICYPCQTSSGTISA